MNGKLCVYKRGERKRVRERGGVKEGLSERENKKAYTTDLRPQNWISTRGGNKYFQKVKILLGKIGREELLLILFIHPLRKKKGVNHETEAKVYGEVGEEKKRKYTIQDDVEYKSISYCSLHSLNSPPLTDI